MENLTKSMVYNYIDFLESKKRNYENVLEQNSKFNSANFNDDAKLITKTKIELLDIIQKEIRMLILGEKVLK